MEHEAILKFSHGVVFIGIELSPTLEAAEFSAQGQVFHCKFRHQVCSSIQRQVFQRKIRKQGCSFTTDGIGAVASRCFPHPTFSVASEQTLKDLKISQENQRGGEESGFG